MNKSLKGNKGEVSKKMMIAIAVMIVAIIAIVGAVYLMKNDETRGWNKKLGVIETDEGIKIPLPEGFKKLDITNKINEGIVIEDNDGNQFVWVPVDFAKFKRETFGLDPNQVGYRIILVDKEEDRDVDWEGVLANPGDYQETSGGIWEPTEEKEYKELMESVEKYGGFYIGRYEATYVSGSREAKDYIPGSKKSVMATEVAETEYEEGMLFNQISLNEAIAASKKMYEDNETVVSHLPYGIEWDATLRWFIDSKSRTLAEINENSGEWGNTAIDKFSGEEVKIANTGEFEETKTNNIYDISGNVFEWSNEYFASKGCGIFRGSFIRSYSEGFAFDSHAGTRSWVTAENDTTRRGSVGFRVFLYVK